jgi:mono/diheme cytochrome c family protein
MKRLNPNIIRFGQLSFILLLALVVFLGITQWAGVQTVHALPEYATRTGESCGTCHVNSGGGGPRTLRGSLWAIRGRPDEVPEIPGFQLAPGVTDGLELYDIACAGCHGDKGEGLFAIELAGTGISRPATRSFILRGIPGTDMPAYEDKLSAEQIEILSDFVTELSFSETEILDDYPLPPAELKCTPLSGHTSCGGGQ